VKKWMVFGSIVLVLAGGVFLAVANLNSWLNDNREMLAERAEAVVGRKVSFSDVGVSLWPTLAVRLSDLRVGDDPAFSDGNFIEAEIVDIGVKVLPLLSGRVEVSRVVLRSPQVTIIETAKGRNMDSLGGGAAAAEEAPASPAGAIVIALIDLRDGRVLYVDRTGKEPVQTAVEKLDFSAKDVSPHEPFAFELSAAILGSSDRNVWVSGTVGPVDSTDPAASRLDLDVVLDPLTIDDALKLAIVTSALPADLKASGIVKIQIHIEGTLEAADLEGKIDARDAAIKLGDSFDKARGVPLNFSFKGKLEGENLHLPTADLVLGDTQLRSDVRISDFANPKVTFDTRTEVFDLTAVTGGGDRGEQVIRDVSIKGTLTLPDAGLNLKAAIRSASGVMSGTAYEQLVLDVAMANQRVTIETLSLRAFDGTLSVNGTYDMRDADRPVFDLHSKLRGMRVESIVASQRASASHFVQGNLDANLHAKGAGAGWEAIKQSLTGTGNVVIDDGRLKDINLGDSVLQGITGVPGMSAVLSPALRQKYPQVFGATDTVFEKLDAKIDIRNGWVNTRNLRLATQDYAIEGNGRISLDGKLDMTMVMRFSESLSQDLIASVKQARYLRGRTGRIEIPVRLTGTLPNVRPIPDIAFIAEAVSRELIGSLLEKALVPKSQRRSAEQGMSQAPDSVTTPPAVDPTEALIRRGLEELFGN